MSVVRGPFMGFLIGLIIVLVMIGLVYLADILLTPLEQANQAIAGATGVDATTEYSSRVEQLTPIVVPVLTALVIAVIAFISIHMKKR
jgi:hypothetical protein